MSALLIYTKSNLAIGHLVTAYADEYFDWIKDHPEYGYIEVDDYEISGATHYLSAAEDGTVSLIAKSPFDVTVTGATITGIPEGTLVSGDAGSCTMDDSGELELSFETPGSYTISFWHPHYLTKEITLEVAPA